jgi:hypothetical protein
VAGDTLTTADVDHLLEKSRGVINGPECVRAESDSGCIACSIGTDHRCVDAVATLNHVDELRADVEDLDKCLVMASKVSDDVVTDEKLG